MSIKTATSCIRLALALVVVAAALAPRPAHAQDAAAESLFKEGQRLMDSGEIPKACEKFEASERIEPKSGTEINLALCRKRNGQTASAWAAYIKTATTASREGNPRRAAVASKGAAALEPRLVYLTIAVPDDVRVGGLVIERNGTAVDEALWNQRVPVDPDEYTISAEAPGYKPWSTSVVVKTKSTTVEVPALENRPEARPPAAAGAAEPSGARDHTADGAEAGPAPSRWTGKRKLSLVLAAVGVAAAGAGIGLGLHANSLESKSDMQCMMSGIKCPSLDGVQTNKKARQYALAANIGYATAGAAVVGAVVLWFVGAPPSRDGVAVLPALDAERVGIYFARSF